MGGMKPRAPKASVSDWTEEFDPTTNSKYFYNKTTGQSSWDPPEGFR